jgi:nucleotide-binding universal stress UspA family protein
MSFATVSCSPRTRTRNEAMIKRILAGVCDPQYSASVSEYASELARRSGAEVTAIAVTDMRRLMDVGSVTMTGGAFTGNLPAEVIEARIRNNQAAIRESLDGLVQRLAAANVPCIVAEESDEPYEALEKISRYHDLMIFGLRGLFDHGVIEEPPLELIRLVESGVRPILAVGPESRDNRRVLIAYSGSIESARTMRHFANLGLWPDAKIKVIHFGPIDGDGPGLLAEARSYLQDFGFDVETEILEGSPKTQLVTHATDWNADLIVVGNSAKSLLRRRVFGETALYTIRESNLPLFLSQ